MASAPNRSRSQSPNRGFSLVESIIALAILAMLISAIASAIAAGTATSGEARLRLCATLAAEELLAEVLISDEVDLLDWNGYQESTSEVRAPDGEVEPLRRHLSRRVEVASTREQLEPSGIEVDAFRVRVYVLDQNERTLSTLERMIPVTTDTSS